MAWTDSVAPNGFIDGNWRFRWAARLFTETPLALSVSASPEAFAAAHDYDIIAHNQFTRLRRAELTERRRVQGVGRDAARWARLCQRWATKHPATGHGA